MNWPGIALLVPLLTCGQSITGRFVDPARASVGNVVVGLLPVGDDWVTRSTHTDPYGRFQFLPAEPGEYVIVARAGGFQSRVLAVRVVAGKEAELGAVELKVGSCDSPAILSCDSFGTPQPPPQPPAPVVDLCTALKSPDRYGNRLIVIVGMLSTLHGWPTLTANCDSMLASGGLTWTNAVLLPEGAAPRQFPKFPNIRGLKKNLEDRAPQRAF